MGVVVMSVFSLQMQISLCWTVHLLPLTMVPMTTVKKDLGTCLQWMLMYINSNRK